MSASPPLDGWIAANQRALVAAVGAVRARLGAGEEQAPAQREAAACMDQPAALDGLCAAFGLTNFEREILLLCAGRDLDARFPDSTPTFGLALAALAQPHWDALSPEGPLRRWHLVELGAGSLTTAPLALDERVLQHLTGTGGLDPRLRPLATPLPPPGPLPPTQVEASARAARLWADPLAPVVQIEGADAATRRLIASGAAEQLGLNLFAISAGDLPEAPADRHALARLWEREAALCRAAVLVELDIDDPPGTSRRARAFLDALASPALVSTREPLAAGRRTLVQVEVGRPRTEEQRVLWATALGGAAERLAPDIEAAVAHFDLSAQQISAAALSALSSSDTDPVWHAARSAARPNLEGLGERIEARAGWDDIVLPELARHLLEDMLRHARHRQRVNEEWGFAARSARGLGLTALFAGPTGTGKTMAAEVLASALRVDLHRIDLSAVMSKYIGETEKNLRRIFDAAEGSGAILLFDEADALFGRRSEVRDSHDRYANLEVGYLLQRMEAYAGLAILTTNLKNNIDPAFLRRIRFVVQFPFPSREQREEIWRRTLPSQTPTEGLDLRRLAQLNISGGYIRNIALNAAVLAADEGQPVRMTHMLRATRAEFAKLEQPLTPAEIGGWA